MSDEPDLRRAMDVLAGRCNRPDLAGIRRRARQLRRRRRTAVGSVIAVCMAGLAGASSLDTGDSEPVAARFGAVTLRPDLSDDLFEALRSGDVRRVEALLEAGADPDRWIQDGITPLMVAAERGDVAAAELLLAYGARVNTVDAAGASPLHHAARSGDSVMVDVLIAAGAHVHVTTVATPTTPLMEATRAGSIDAVRLLVDAGADPNRQDRTGRTVLDHALDSPDPVALVGLLLDLGAEHPLGTEPIVGRVDEIVADLAGRDVAGPRP